MKTANSLLELQNIPFGTFTPQQLSINDKDYYSLTANMLTNGYSHWGQLKINNNYEDILAQKIMLKHNHVKKIIKVLDLIIQNENYQMDQYRVINIPLHLKNSSRKNIKVGSILKCIKKNNTNIDNDRIMIDSHGSTYNNTDYKLRKFSKIPANTKIFLMTPNHYSFWSPEYMYVDDAYASIYYDNKYNYNDIQVYHEHPTLMLNDEEKLKALGLDKKKPLIKNLYFATIQPRRKNLANISDQPKSLRISSFELAYRACTNEIDIFSTTKTKKAAFDLQGFFNAINPYNYKQITIYTCRSTKNPIKHSSFIQFPIGGNLSDLIAQGLSIRYELPNIIKNRGRFIQYNNQVYSFNYSKYSKIFQTPLDVKIKIELHYSRSKPIIELDENDQYTLIEDLALIEKMENEINQQYENILTNDGENQYLEKISQDDIEVQELLLQALTKPKFILKNNEEYDDFIKNNQGLLESNKIDDQEKMKIQILFSTMQDSNKELFEVYMQQKGFALHFKKRNKMYEELLDSPEKPIISNKLFN